MNSFIIIFIFRMEYENKIDECDKGSSYGRNFMDIESLESINNSLAGQEISLPLEKSISSKR